ncbi:MAG: DUF1549 domain-containing protein [Planctomycetaceae bacterium]|nr:DUF1549 domain-containing protein [Planctomycetaceae bacterium]MBT6484888.1 DUF1549 domain-containing protein [Planctomycetaceae bacterium]
MQKPRFLVASLGIALALLLTTNGSAEAAKKPDDAKKASPKSVSAIPMSQVSSASRQIDKLIEADYAKHKIDPNPLTSDELFVRRIYLDVVGRIPSHDETVAFLDSTDSKKRSALIDELLDSEGYVSHQFNYWADLLRLQSRMRYAPAQPYLEFVKTSLRENKPYDQFVRELITAEGYTWDNGAAGYYLRDVGMPLDNMSNTAQVFLGTQLVCAQCHDHPFDSWTQKQYYQLAAFTYGIETRDRRNPKYMELRQMRRDEKLDNNVFRSANRILQPLAYNVNETERKLRLPDDYQYDDAKPKDQIDPAAIFGDEVVIKEGDSRKEVYARWMTSPTNPRFTNVIANRLWKRAMGIGLVEPVDDFKDGVDASNPEVLKNLVALLVDSKYDLKQFLRVLYNTKTYQREVTTEEVAAEDTYYFPGPVLQRLSAEQLWDSLLTMTIPYVDERKGLVRNYGRYAAGEELVNTEMKEILVMAEAEAKRRTAQVKYTEMTRDLQKQLRVASRIQDRDAVNKLREEMNGIRKQVFGEAGERRMQRDRNRARQRQRETDPRWAGFPRDFVRASEVESPARPGHFLRQFGQSDRETIENANTEATVPQILTLLNGPMFSQLTSRNSQLQKNLADVEDPKEQLDVIFVTILNRRPTPEETELVLPHMEGKGGSGVRDVIWSLLNTRQFMFVQ